MKYPLLNTQQGGIQSSRLMRHACRLEKWMSKFFLMFIVAENTWSVNIRKYNFKLQLFFLVGGRANEEE